MKIIFYSNTADSRRVDKSDYLIKVAEVDNVIFKEGQSILTPSITIQTTDLSLINKVNYCYIDSLNAYYYITDARTERGNRFIFELDEDVLFTNKDEIYNLKCIIARQEFKNNQYLNDQEYKVYSYNRIQTKEFPDGFTNGSNASFILVMAGGVD